MLLSHNITLETSITLCILRPSEYQYYVKRNYFTSPSTAEDDLRLTEQQREALFDNIDPDDLFLPPSKKKSRKYLNSDAAYKKNVKEAIDSYKQMLKEQMKLIIPRFTNKNGQCS